MDTAAKEEGCGLGGIEPDSHQETFVGPEHTCHVRSALLEGIFPKEPQPHPNAPPTPLHRFRPWWNLLKSLDGTVELQQRPFRAYQKLHAMHCLEFPFWVLRGAGQVVFLNNPLSGAFILLAIFWENWFMGACGLLAVVTSTALGAFLGCDLGMLRNGLVGYNALILGEGIAFFSGGDKVVVAFTVFFWSCALVLVQEALAKLAVKWNLPLLTFPFNVMLLSLLAALFHFSYVPAGSLLQPTPLDPVDGANLGSIGLKLTKVLRGTAIGVGQIFFVGSLGPSLVILFSALPCSRVLCVGLFGGSLLGALAHIAVGSNKAAIYAGLSSYNSALTVPAILFFMKPGIAVVPLCLFGVLLTLIFEAATLSLCTPFGLPIGTLPFCIVTVIVLLQENQWTERIALDRLSTPEAHITPLLWILQCLRKKEKSTGGPMGNEMEVVGSTTKEDLIRSLEEAYYIPPGIQQFKTIVSEDSNLANSDKEELLRSLEECDELPEDWDLLREQLLAEMDPSIIDYYV